MKPAMAEQDPWPTANKKTRISILGLQGNKLLQKPDNNLMLFNNVILYVLFVICLTICALYNNVICIYIIYIYKVIYVHIKV